MVIRGKGAICRAIYYQLYDSWYLGLSLSFEVMSKAGLKPCTAGCFGFVYLLHPAATEETNSASESIGNVSRKQTNGFTS